MQFTTPNCECFQIDRRQDVFSDVVCNDDGTVDFTYEYKLTNLLIDGNNQFDAFYSFIFSDPADNFETDAFDIVALFGMPLPYGATECFSTRITGALPESTIDFSIALHGQDLQDCCILPHDVVAPDCLAGVFPPSSFIVGDMNEDGEVNLLDVAPFIDLLSTGTFHFCGDINADGQFNLLDVAPFIELLTD